ncbi:MAG: hypothetical protein M3R67_02070 [Acidobacteriota bacterium]|nr:hypothetical protein [Acidobacteriota bacterium]
MAPKIRLSFDMLLDFFLNKAWAAIGLWALLYCLDYAFTYKAAKIYKAGAGKHFGFGGGYELNPFFKDDIAQLRRFSFRFFLLLLLVAGLLLILHGTGLREYFAFVWGLMICLQLTVHFRHLRNLAVFYYAKDSQGVNGRIEYEHWLSLRLSSIEFFYFSVFYLFLFLLWGNLFMLGGATGCLVLALRHLYDSRRSRGLAQNKVEEIDGTTSRNI